MVQIDIFADVLQISFFFFRTSPIPNTQAMHSAQDLTTSLNARLTDLEFICAGLLDDKTDASSVSLQDTVVRKVKEVEADSRAVLGHELVSRLAQDLDGTYFQFFWVPHKVFS